MSETYQPEESQEKGRIHARVKILLSVLHGVILEPDETLILQRIAESGYNETMALCRVLVKVRQAPPLHGG